MATPWLDNFVPQSRFDYTTDQTVTLLVGPDEQRMLVQGPVIALTSDFFKAALKKVWAAGNSRVVKLPYENPDTIALYLDFVYTHTLSSTLVNASSFVHDMYETLATLYVLGDRMLDASLRKAAVHEIIRCTTLEAVDGSTTFPSNLAINAIYNGTTSSSPARCLMVDLWVRNGAKAWVRAGLHPEFLMELGQETLDELAKSGQELSCRSREIEPEDSSQ